MQSLNPMTQIDKKWSHSKMMTSTKNRKLMFSKARKVALLPAGDKVNQKTYPGNFLK